MRSALKAKKILFSLVALASLLQFQGVASAVTIEELQAQIRVLQAQINELLKAQESKALFFNRNLHYGLRQDLNVKRLQEYLIGKGFLASGLNTGNFFSVTRDAVLRFQRQSGIAGANGVFGPATRARVNEELRIIGEISKLQNELKLAEAERAAAVEKELSTYSIDQRPQYDVSRIAMKTQDLINQERLTNGVLSLGWDSTLAETARLHSEDQATDNIAVTNPDFRCHYPLIRHEGVRGGYDLKDRLEGKVDYRSAGENIVMFSAATNLVYKRLTSEPITECPQIRDYPNVRGPKEERLALFNEVLLEALNVSSTLKKIDWVNKEWLSEDDIARKAVTLWLNSPGHRVNMLRSDFNYGGVGVVVVNDYFIITHHLALQ